MLTSSVSRMVVMAVLGAMLASCAAPQTMPAQTGVPELDKVVQAVVNGDAAQLRSLIQLTTSHCTNAEGLGGPPKCLPGEAEGTVVEVLPILGAEGGFIRGADLDSWSLPRTSDLYAAYQVSDSAYSEPDYPAGEYALVFAGSDDTQSSFTLHIHAGGIVRVDYGPGSRPEIRPEDVARYLVQP